MKNSHIILATATLWANYLIIDNFSGYVFWAKIAPLETMFVILISSALSLALFWRYGLGWEEDIRILLFSFIAFFYTLSGGIVAGMSVGPLNPYVGWLREFSAGEYVMITIAVTCTFIAYNWWRNKQDRGGLDGVSYGLPEKFK